MKESEIQGEIVRLTSQQRAVLALMVPGERAFASDLARRGGLRFRSVTRLLANLAKSGYVTRVGMTWALTQKAIEGPRKRGRPPKPETARRIQRQSFTERHSDPEADRYGRLFLIVRVMRCDLELSGYDGPGHETCGNGVQGGHTAHHPGHLDSDGLLPGCGRAHDLYAGLGSETTVKAFRKWCEEHGWILDQRAMHYVERAREIANGDEHRDGELAW